MVVYVLNSNSCTENGIHNETNVFSTIEKAQNAFQKAIEEIEECFPDFQKNTEKYQTFGDKKTELMVRDDWYWWNLTIKEIEVM